MSNDTKWAIVLGLVCILAFGGIVYMILDMPPTPRQMIDENNARYLEHGVTYKGMRIWKHPDGAWYDMYGEKVIFDKEGR